MFKDSNITRMDSWSLLEESDSLPEVAFPAFIGSGKIGVALDAAGLQSLPDRLCKRYHCFLAPWHSTQSDLYLFRDGMISEHLWHDEMKLTGFDSKSPSIAHTAHRNLMPLGYLTQNLTYGGQTYEGDDLRRVAASWRRDWSLREGIVRTQYAAIHKQALPSMFLSVEVFAPYGGETVYFRLDRTANAVLTGDCAWSVKVALQTRHGLSIYDQENAVAVGRHTIVATIDSDSEHKPLEPYSAVYAIGVDGADAMLASDGISVTLNGQLEEAQSAWLRLDLRRLAGEERRQATALAAKLEDTAQSFSRRDYVAARAAHVAEMAAFWSRTADVEVIGGDEFETKRRFMLHMSEYLLRCGNDWGFGGTAQFLLFHQNGWQAGNFHDHHYIVDGIARANMFDEAIAHCHWLRKVMRPGQRVFPWIINYDGTAPIPAERDRAPMSDANRAILAIRIYELAGAGRETLLREDVYPIVKAVADQAAEWFGRTPDGFVLNGVETDVMDDAALVNEIGTVVIFDAVLRKAVEYSRHLQIDEDGRKSWSEMVSRIVYEQGDGRYLAYRDAPAGARTSPWFANGLYLGETHEFLDLEMFKRTIDAEPPTTSCNYPWLNSAHAGTQLRLGRPDRAEQLMVDSLENRIHGPGYFEEIAPIGLYGLPPLVTAHGAYVVAACEQIVLSDFWRPAIAIGTGIPSRLRAQIVRFHSLRAIRGITVSGQSEPRRMTATLTPSGERVELPVTLPIPACAGSMFTVKADGRDVDYTFAGETVTVMVSLADKPVTLTVDG